MGITSDGSVAYAVSQPSRPKRRSVRTASAMVCMSSRNKLIGDPDYKRYVDVGRSLLARCKTNLQPNGLQVDGSTGSPAEWHR